MKEIFLGRRGEISTLIDDEDFDLLYRFRWSKSSFGYVYRQEGNSRTKLHYILMHRIILARMLGRPLERKEQVDHIDRNPLNNQRSNLRLATNQQNVRNTRSREGTSKYKGVSWCKQTETWVAVIHIDAKKKNLGRFRSEIAAATAYDKAAKDKFGEFANLNFPDGGTPPENVAEETRLRTHSVKMRQGSSKYKGVSFDKRRNMWRANYKNRALGRFQTENEAALAYNSAALADDAFAIVNAIT